MVKVIENERQFKSLNKFFWLFVAVLPSVVLVHFFLKLPFIEYFSAFYSVFFLVIWFVARFIAFPSYFNFEYNSKKISVRFRPYNFFDAFGLFKEKGFSKIEIDKSDFSGYKINEEFAGLRRNLVLYKNNENGKTIGQHINISFLTIQEITHLIKALHTFQLNKAS